MTTPGNTQTVAGPAEASALDSQSTRMHIGVVAELTEMSIPTLRYYDQMGLVTPSARTIGGFRLYTPSDIDRLTTIRRMKALNFTLDEMKHLFRSLETVGDDQANTSARREAETFIAACVARAEEACIALRKQLNYAEEFMLLLATSNVHHAHPRG